MARIAAVVSNGCAPDPRVMREARWMVEAGHEVTIHAFDRLENLQESEIVDGVRIIRHRVGFTPYGGLLSTKLGLNKFIAKVKREIGIVDVVHCHDQDTLEVGLSNPGKCLFDMHDLYHTWVLMPNPRSFLRKIISRRLKKRLLRLAPSADAVITSSQGFVSWLAENGIAATSVENRPSSRLLPDSAEGRVIGYLGRVREVPSFTLLLAALKSMSDDERPKLMVAGDGVGVSEVARMVREGVDEGWLEAEVFGAFDESQKEELMSSISVMYAMYPPKRGNIMEGAIPVKMFDAASFGRPSIVNAGCLMGSICEDEGLGRAVPWGDQEALAQAILEQIGKSVRLDRDEESERTAFMRVFESLC